MINFVGQDEFDTAGIRVTRKRMFAFKKWNRMELEVNVITAAKAPTKGSSDNTVIINIMTFHNHNECHQPSSHTRDNKVYRSQILEAVIICIPHYATRNSKRILWL